MTATKKDKPFYSLYADLLDPKKWSQSVLNRGLENLDKAEDEIKQYGFPISMRGVNYETDISDFSDEDLLEELKKRGIL